MRYFSQLDENNIVLNVIIAEDESILNRLGGKWIETFKDSENKNFGDVDSTYDEEKDDFIRPKPYDSWILNNRNRWEAPIPIPDEENNYRWNEDIKNWEIVENVFLNKE